MSDTTIKEEEKVNKRNSAKIEAIASMQKMFTGNYFYAAGKRKTSISKVRLYQKGEGKIIINGQDISKMLIPSQIEKLITPLGLTGHNGAFNITIKVIGGGVYSQLDAMRHGIAKALIVFNPELKTTLKKEGHLTRDSRKKERKKPGLKRARKSPTFVKR